MRPLSLASDNASRPLLSLWPKIRIPPRKIAYLQQIFVSISQQWKETDFLPLPRFSPNATLRIETTEFCSNTTETCFRARFPSVCQYIGVSGMHDLSFETTRLKRCMQPLITRAMVRQSVAGLRGLEGWYVQIGPGVSKTFFEVVIQVESYSVASI
mgnify:CR=1 FL=1